MFARLFGLYSLIVLLALYAAGAFLLPEVGPGRLAGFAFVTALVAAWPAYVVTRRFAEPVRGLTDALNRVGESGPGRKVYSGGFGLVGPALRAFNAMSERLAERVARLEDERQQLRAVLSGMVEGVLALDARQRILFANDRAAELLDFSPTRAVGRHFWEVVRQRPVQELVTRAMAAEEPSRRELDWTGPSAKSLALYVARLSGKPSDGAVVVLHDTSELRRLERVRQEFVANVSHELKTPLAVIKASVETLIDGAADDPAHRGPFLDQIDEQADRLHALILDLLSLARIESGTEALDIGPVPLGSAVADCLERHRARAEAKRQRLEATGEGLIAVWADREALDTILDNLVDNAIKYTPDGGGIVVRWSAAETDQVAIEVADTGIGIPERDLPRVFERFYRVDKARSRELGGTGLGLSIVKHLVQMLGGTVKATSQLGAGTTFRVCLPWPRGD
jgi:two-component system phosphate regulon sensor histidine kinase PhoR